MTTEGSVKDFSPLRYTWFSNAFTSEQCIIEPQNQSIIADYPLVVSQYKSYCGSSTLWEELLFSLIITDY